MSALAGPAIMLAVFGMVVGLMVFLARREGRKSLEASLGKAAAAAKDRQLKAALDAPKTRDELVDRVRKGGLCLALAILLAGCSTAAPNACPPVKPYGDEFNAAFADQLEALPLPENWAIVEALTDYYALRRMAEACR